VGAGNDRLRIFQVFWAISCGIPQAFPTHTLRSITYPRRAEQAELRSDLDSNNFHESVVCGPHTG